MKNQFFVIVLSFLSFNIFSQSTSLPVSGEENEKRITENDPLLLDKKINIDPKKVEEKKFCVNIFYNPSFQPFLESGKKNVNVFWGVDILYHTPKTYHYFGYDVAENALLATNGYFLKKNLGTYAFFSHGLNKHHEENNIILPTKKVFSLGLEYFFETKYLDLIFYSEIGTDFHSSQEFFKEKFFAFGIILEGHALRF